MWPRKDRGRPPRQGNGPETAVSHPMRTGPSIPHAGTTNERLALEGHPAALIGSAGRSIAQGVGEATKTAGTTDHGGWPGTLAAVEEATETAAAVAGLDGSRRRDEATLRRAHTLQESPMRAPTPPCLTPRPHPCPSSGCIGDRRVCQAVGHLRRGRAS